MSEDEVPIRAYIGNYEIGTTDVVIPLEALKRADAAIVAERERRREAAAAMAMVRPEPRKPWWARMYAWVRSRQS